MPRRTSGRKPTLALAVCDAPSGTQPQLPPNNLDILRKHWKWAAISQFLVTFAPVFSTVSFTIAEVELDLAHGLDQVLSKIMQRLLYALTYDKKIGPDTWQNVLRKQYQKRHPLANPIGSGTPLPLSREDLDSPASDDEKVAREGKPDGEGDQGSAEQARDTPFSQSECPPQNHKDWNVLPLLTKLDSLYLVTEWLFQNPTRIKTLMRVEEEDAVAWRIEPIGHDGKRNAYWFIGTRLWIQRALPLSIDPSKRKRPATTKGKTRPPAKRRRLREESRQKNSQPPQRAAKVQATQRLNERIAASQALQHSRAVLPPSRALGTRTSTRLRGQQRGEWQDVPPEWLEEPKQAMSSRLKTGLESDEDSISDLTELSESDHDDDPQNQPDGARDDSLYLGDTENNADSIEDIIEWETICITTEDWERFAQKLGKATHYAEKALYRRLSQSVIPFVTDELREQERQKRLEEAMTHRKRSSRIAIKESEKAEATSKKLAEERERSGREKRLEARILANTQIETPRERRRREREEKDALRRTKYDLSFVPRPISLTTPTSQETTSTDGPSTKTRSSSLVSTGPIPGSLPSQGEEWVLDCEVCHKHGINPDDASPMMSCGLCSKWQHIRCHDSLDARAGRPRRNWDLVDFICRMCRSTQSGFNQPGRDPAFQALKVPNINNLNFIPYPQSRIPELHATSSSSPSHSSYQTYGQPTSLHYTHALTHQENPKSSAPLPPRLHQMDVVFPSTPYIQPAPCVTLPLCHGQLSNPNAGRPGFNISPQPSTYLHQYSQWQVPLPTSETNHEAQYMAPQFSHYRTSYPSTS
ncbi:hypothetical protein BDN72DRAFT_877858 [Pluteus cervinus]|uniref:Uncharacterized protein n=1 Tax=Pluteus cervinus TaxID=181527 RepID=A0ACD3AYC2_9AGAR|nr:hypothetical protein BDN72DRAFT_877858 [Pluteus cervinus]